MTAIFDGSAREIKEADAEDSQIDKLRKELSQVEDERDDLVETLQNLKKIME